MAGAMGCPAATNTPQQPYDHFDACGKLVTCGVLAADYLSSTGTSCSKSSDCQGGTGVCIRNSQGQNRCAYHRLDYSWCVAQFVTTPSDPCSGLRYSASQVSAIIDCIRQTPCEAMGLPFAAKQLGTDHTALDSFTCSSASERRRTATVCDNGLLRY